MKPGRAGRILDSSDCDDGAADVHPDAPEWCDDVDSDCDGVSDTLDPDVLDECTTIGCADGTVEVEWSEDVVGCRGPDQYWSDYWGEVDLHCAPGWDMAGSWIVNALLTDDGYDSSPWIHYAFNGEGCDGHNFFATTPNSYAQ